MGFQGFENLEDMFTAIREAGKKAFANASEEQKQISWGDHYVMFVEDFAVFGEIYTAEQNKESEIRLGATEAEAQYTADRLRETYDRGYRFGRAYSVVVPDGELGENHILNMAKITKEQFEEARKLNWNMEYLATSTNWFADLLFKSL